MSAISLIPAVLPKTFEEVVEVEKMIRETIPLLQIDVVDGVFAKPASWPYNGSGDVSSEDIFSTFVVELEIDMMTSSPAAALEYWMEAGAQRFIFHYSSVPEKELSQLLIQTKQAGYETMVALTIDDNPTALVPLLDSIDGVQCMGIHPVGMQGAKLNPAAIDLIHTVRSIVGMKPITIDGGVRLDNIKKLLEAGVTRIVSGSALLHSPEGFQETHKQFLEEIYQHETMLEIEGE